MTEEPVPADWTKTDETPEFPEIGNFPPLLFEASINRLLNRAEALTKEEETLSLIYPPLRDILTRAPIYGNREETGALLKRIYSFLKLQETQDRLSKHISSRTIEAMLRYINPEATGLNTEVLLLKKPHQRLLLPAVIPIASNLTISSLCLSEQTEVKGYFKSFDDKNFRFVLRNSVSELIESAEPALRALAAELLSSRNVIANRNDLLMADYDIERCLQDSDEAVRGRALHSKTAAAVEKSGCPC